MILNRKVEDGQLSNTQCNIRFNGSSAYYQQKAVTIKGQQQTTGPMLQLTLAQFQIMSSQLGYTPTGSGLTGDSICNEYAQDLMTKKVLHLSVVEYAADHITVWSKQDFGLPQADVTKMKDKAIRTDMSNNLDTYPEFTYFVRDGGTLDITASFLKNFSDSSYTSTTDSGSISKGEASLTIDGNLKEITLSDSRCGLKYIIDIGTISTDGGTSLLRGKVSDSAVAIPANENDGTANGFPTLTKCSDLKTMLDGVATQGIEISGIQNICTDNSCTNFYSNVRIGEPNTRTATSSMESILIPFQSANFGTAKILN